MPSPVVHIALSRRAVPRSGAFLSLAGIFPPLGGSFALPALYEPSLDEPKRQKTTNLAAEWVSFPAAASGILH